MKNIFTKTSLTLMLLLATSCTDVEFLNLNSGWIASATSILSNPKTAANGRSELLLKLRIHDENGAGIGKVQLKALNIYDNITYKGCTESTDDGIVYCRFYATKPGITTITLFDNFGRFPVDLTFVKPEPSINITNISFSYDIRQTAGGYSVSSKIQPMSGIEQTVSGYKVNTLSVLEKRF